jgi:serine/threonine-protein kinase
MSGDQPPGAAGSPLALKLRVNAVCDRFEKAWKDAPRPIEDYLAAVSEPERAVHFQELLKVEIELRGNHGETPTPEEYHRRFKQYSHLIDGCFAIPTDDPPLPPVPGYEMLDVLGEEGMGVVYLARWIKPDITVALKMIRAGRFASQMDKELLKSEAKTLFNLNHDNIVRIYETGQHEGQPYFTMEVMDGGSLDDKIRAGDVGPRDAARWLLQVARGVAAAHEKDILHCDLKPGNVMLDGEGVAHVTDFGLAKRLAPTSPEAEPADAFGTIQYIAPEQTCGMVTKASDIYGLGATLYALLTGEPPFTEDSSEDLRKDPIPPLVKKVRNQEPIPPRRLNPRVNADLEQVCLKCLRKAPEQRHASAAELAEDLEAYLGGKAPPNSRQPTNLAAIWEAIVRPIVYRLEVEPSKRFGQSNVMSAIVNGIGHLAVFLILCFGLPVVFTWLAFAVIWALMAFNVWWFLLRRIRSAHPAEGYVVGTYVGYVLGYAVLLLAGVLGGADPLVGFYPYLAVMTGLVVFVHGTLFWGPLYLAGLGYYALALAMYLGPEWPAQLVVSLFWGPLSLVVIAPLAGLGAAQLVVSLFWGPLSPAGLGYYTLALVMYLGPTLAPLEFAVYHCSYLIMMSLHFKRSPNGPGPTRPPKVKP